MTERPLYSKIFSRDFILINMEIWWRGEARNDKQWIKERQPYQPYIVFEKTADVVNCFYDLRGVQWIKDQLITKYKADRSILETIQNNFMQSVLGLRRFYRRTYELNHDELCKYLDIYEMGYVWFEAAWWLWDMSDTELQGVALPEDFKKLREQTQDFVPESEKVFRTTLPRLYPKIADFVEVIAIDEVKQNKISDTTELKKRMSGYFLVDGRVFAGAERTEIEHKYGIRLETTPAENVSEINGVTAYAGKIRGNARIVLNLKQLNKVKPGDILISAMTLPDFLAAIEKSSAFVTDEGGQLSHAAITARELKKPCVIGTKIATQVIKDGDIIEVDAIKGKVKIIERAK